MNREDAAALVEIQNRSYETAGPSIRESYPPSQAMNVDRLASFLESKHYVVLATTHPDGRAQAAPVAFTVWDGAFWFASVRGARLRNLRANPWASVVVMEGEGSAHRAVIAEGPAKLIRAGSNGVPSGVRNRWTERHGDAPDWAAAFIELRPARLFSYDATLDPDERVGT